MCPSVPHSHVRFLQSSSIVADEMVEEGFMNYKKGIKDPSVFVVPPECNNANILRLVYCSFVDFSTFSFRSFILVYLFFPGILSF